MSRTAKEYVMIVQSAPDPVELRELVSQLSYKNWSFQLVDDMDRGRGCRGTTLVIKHVTQDTYGTMGKVELTHFVAVPAVFYNRQSWQRWLLDQVLRTEQHETCEFFKIGDERPFAPTHAPGWDPCEIRETVASEDVDKDVKGRPTCHGCGLLRDSGTRVRVSVLSSTVEAVEGPLEP